MLLRTIRHLQFLPLLCAVFCLTLAFPTQTPSAYDEVRQLQVTIPHSGPVFAPLGSSISIPCMVSLSSIPTASSSSPVEPRVKWTVVSGGVETLILVARDQRVKVNEVYRDRAALLNYTSSLDDLSLWLGDLRSSDSGHYRCEVQQGLEDASDLMQLKVKGVVFHYRDALGRYAFTFHQAQRACEAIGAQIATPDQLLAAYYDGYEQCDAGWLADQSVRYPIQVPREGCHGDMEGQPGVRNYGTMDPDDLFDAYCYIEKIDGEMFHENIPQHLSFAEAQSYCRAAGAELATTAQLYLAWSEGLDRCSPGWLSDGSVRYPIITPRDRCGGSQAGVKTVYRFSNQTGFPELSSLHDVYCFKENRNTSTDSPMDYMATEPEDVEQNVVILLEKDQELHLNQQEEQVEREAQSVLESLPLIPVPFTEENQVDIDSTIISDITESPINTTSTLDLIQPSDETLPPTEMSYNSQHPTALMNSTISSTETYNSPQNKSLLPSVYNETDSHQNLSFTFHQSELESTTYEPHTQNQTILDTEPLEKLIQAKEVQETNLTLNRSQENYTETDSNHTQEETLWAGTPITLDPLLQEAAVEDPLQMSLTTQASEEERTILTQLAQTTKFTIEALTSTWVVMDGSGDTSQERDRDVEAVSSISGVNSYPSSSVSASSAPTEPLTAGPDATMSSGSRLSDKIALEVLSTAPQLWESPISRQEGSTSLEIEDTLNMESEETNLHSTKSEDQLVSEVSLATTESPVVSNTSHSPTESTTARYRTSGYRVYLDTVTGAYEEASGSEPGTINPTLREDIKVAPTLEEETKVSPTLGEEANISFSVEKEVEIIPNLVLKAEAKVAPTLEEANSTLEEEANVSSTLEEDANVSSTLEEDANVSSTLEEANISSTLEAEANAAPNLEEDITIAPTVEEDITIAPTLEEDITIAPTLEEDITIAPTLEEDITIAPTLEEDINIAPTLEEDITIAPTLEEDINIAPTFDEEAIVAPTFEEDLNVAPTFEGDVNDSPTLEDFTVIPLNSQTSDWALMTTAAGPQESLNDHEYSRKTPSIAASDSSLSTKSTAASAKTTTTTITTTTHWSRQTWSPATTTPKVLHETAEPEKMTIPPVDHGLVDFEISLTKPPTLLILPNERAAVGGTGKSSDACLDDPCLNGGTCTDRGGKVKCLCLPTYGGDLCQTDLERCETGWDKFHGFCYRHFSQRLSWEVAEQQCRMQGAHLVSIMTPEEQSYINSNYKEYQWTGLNDKTIEDDFRWSDGNPLLYENWYRGQPDSYFLSGEDCVVMVWHDDGRWSDVPCNYHLSYTCKKGTSSCGPPPKVRNTSTFGKTRQRYETNAVVRYHCTEGFQQRLNPLVRCLSGGNWERPQIQCIAEAGGPTLDPEVTSPTDINFATTEDDFEASKDILQYWNIRF